MLTYILAGVVLIVYYLYCSWVWSVDSLQLISEQILSDLWDNDLFPRIEDWFYIGNDNRFWPKFFMGMISITVPLIFFGYSRDTTKVNIFAGAMVLVCVLAYFLRKRDNVFTQKERKALEEVSYYAETAKSEHEAFAVIGKVRKVMLFLQRSNAYAMASSFTS